MERDETVKFLFEGSSNTWFLLDRKEIVKSHDQNRL